MKNAVVFINENPYYCPDKQRVLVKEWLRKNQINLKELISESPSKLPEKITIIMETQQIDFFVCADLCLMGCSPNAIIQNYARIDSVGITVVAVANYFLNTVDGDERNVVRDLVANMDGFEKLKVSHDTRRRIKRITKNGAVMGAPKKRTAKKDDLCVELKGQGLSRKEIAKKLNLSLTTVGTILRERFKKGSS